jgi:hypothetical protein
MEHCVKQANCIEMNSTPVGEERKQWPVYNIITFVSQHGLCSQHAELSCDSSLL